VNKFTCECCDQEYETDITDEDIAQCCNEIDMSGKEIMLLCDECYKVMPCEGETIH